MYNILNWIIFLHRYVLMKFYLNFGSKEPTFTHDRGEIFIVIIRILLKELSQTF